MENNDAKITLLKNILGNYLNPDEIEILIKHCQIVAFNKDDFIFKQGKAGHGMYIIVEGIALVVVRILGEGVTHIAALDEGNFLGEVSLIGQRTCATSVIASTPMRCLHISDTFFNMLAEFFPKLKYHLINLITHQIYERLQALHTKIITYMTEADMVKQSFFGEIVKSLSNLMQASLEETTLNKAELRKSHPFKLFSEQEFNALLKNSSIIKAPKYADLFYSGQVGIYIVLRGAVQSSIIHNNKTAKLSVLGPTKLFTNLLDEEKPISLVNYTTCEKAVLLAFNAENITNLQKNEIEIWYKLFNLIGVAYVGLEWAMDKLDIRLNSELYNR